MKNNRLISLRDGYGFNQNKMAEAIGIHINLLSKMENCHYEDISVRDLQLVCDFFDVYPGWLFGSIVKSSVKSRKSIEIRSHQNISSSRAESMRILSHPEERMMEIERRRMVQKILTKSSSLIEQKIISERYGIGNDCEIGLIELADKYKLSRSRIDQIEGKVFRKIRTKISSDSTGSLSVKKRRGRISLGK